jgi:hypothetical protein
MNPIRRSALRGMSKLLVVLLTLMSIAPAQAQRRSQGNSYKCGEYIAMRRESSINDGAFTSYAFGYIAAYNLWGNRAQVKTPKGTTTLAYLDKFCANHPLEFVSAGLNALIADLGGYKLQPTKP